VEIDKLVSIIIARISAAVFPFAAGYETHCLIGPIKRFSQSAFLDPIQGDRMTL
jgi:hypothetical protein